MTGFCSFEIESQGIIKTVGVMEVYIKREVLESKVWISMRSLESRGEACGHQQLDGCRGDGSPRRGRRYGLRTPCLRPGPATID